MQRENSVGSSFDFSFSSGKLSILHAFLTKASFTRQPIFSSTITQSAKLGKSVLVVEKGRRVGGVSVHTGTIPSKTLRETVLNLSGWRQLRSRINDVRSTWPPRPHAGKPTKLARGLLWGASAH